MQRFESVHGEVPLHKCIDDRCVSESQPGCDAHAVRFVNTREHMRRRDPREQHDLDERNPPENLVKSYPSFSYGTECDVPVFAFDKLDGSNVRAEWTKKKGWNKFGTRHRLVDVTDPIFGKVPESITSKYGETLARALSDAGYDRAMCFFEFWGPSSFAGMHDVNEHQTATLLDVAPFNQGILMPDRFLKLFGHLDVPKVLYHGMITPEFVEAVRNSSLEGMTFEGVVCKAANPKKTKQPIMFKQKSRAWLDKLHSYCNGNSELFNALR